MAAPLSELGYLPDKIDVRDRTAATLFASRPMSAILPEVDWRPQIQKILAQLNLGSCVAHGVLGGVRLKNVFDGIVDPKLGKDRPHRRCARGRLLSCRRVVRRSRTWCGRLFFGWRQLPASELSLVGSGESLRKVEKRNVPFNSTRASELLLSGTGE